VALRAIPGSPAKTRRRFRRVGVGNTATREAATREPGGPIAGICYLGIHST
jgi:hypothetical protein